MSGHSKWSQIKRQKGAADVKRGAVFSRLTNAIILAARNGGDPNSNFTLKMAVEKARAENMPKDNIERAIKKGTGELGGAKFEEALYEVIAPFGIGILVEVATDNKNRSTANLKNVLNKFGAKLASSGAVAYQFNKMGKIAINATGKDHEELELAAIDAGAEDFEEQEDTLAIYTKPNELEKMKRTLEEQGLEIKEANLSWEPQNTVRIENKEDAEKIVKLMEQIEDLEDVSSLYTNVDIAPEALT